jgi:hypothetical protein
MIAELLAPDEEQERAVYDKEALDKAEVLVNTWIIFPSTGAPRCMICHSRASSQIASPTPASGKEEWTG